MPAPIALFAYKRAKEFRLTLQALQANYLAIESELFVFIDGPKQEEDLPKVEQVRQLAQKITGFKQVHLHISEQNKGCASSIIGGVTKVLQQHSSIIVVEDDIVTTPNFLDFINQGLETYVSNQKVFSIGGYSFPFERPTNYSDDVYFYGRTCAWGWGIWADRWSKIDWTIADFNTFIGNNSQRKAFNYYGSDRVRMLRRTLEGKIDTWDIRLCYNQFKQKSLTIYPVISKTTNIGFNGGDGMHAKSYNRYKTVPDKGIQRRFTMPHIVTENKWYTKQFRHQYSISVRLLGRLKTYIGIQ